MRTPFILEVFNTASTYETIIILSYLIYDNMIYILYDKILLFVLRALYDLLHIGLSILSILMYAGFLMFYVLYFIYEYIPIFIGDFVPAFLEDVRNIVINLINKIMT